VPFFAILAMILIIVIVALNPPLVLFTMAIIYAFSGPVMAIYIRRNKKVSKG